MNAIEAGERATHEQWVEDVIERAKPSIVKINIWAHQSGVINPEKAGKTQPDRYVKAGGGSGSFISADGYILTNHHVARHILDGALYTAVLNSGEEVPLKVVYLEPTTPVEGYEEPLRDVALLKVDIPGFRSTPLAMGESSKVKVGQRIVSLGSPLNEDPAWASTGIVSGVRAHTPGSSPLPPGEYISTDASHSEGISGGPTLDENGRMIGLNGFVNPSQKGFSSIAYLTPVDKIKALSMYPEAFSQTQQAFIRLYQARAEEESVSLKTAFNSLLKELYQYFGTFPTTNEQRLAAKAVLEDLGVKKMFFDLLLASPNTKLENYTAEFNKVFSPLGVEPLFTAEELASANRYRKALAQEIKSGRAS